MCVFYHVPAVMMHLFRDPLTNLGNTVTIQQRGPGSCSVQCFSVLPVSVCEVSAGSDHFTESKDKDFDDAK